MTQGIEKQIGVFPAIEPERHLIEVGWKMFRADLVPASHDAAFQERESIFDCVGNTHNPEELPLASEQIQ